MAEQTKPYLVDPATRVKFSQPADSRPAIAMIEAPFMSDDIYDYHSEVQIRTLSKFRVAIEKALHDGVYQFTSEEQGRWLFIVMQRGTLDLENAIRAIESAVPMAFRRYLGKLILDRPSDSYAGAPPARIRCILYAVLPYELHSINDRPYDVSHWRLEKPNIS
jgi:hypothetical protein